MFKQRTYTGLKPRHLDQKEKENSLFNQSMTVDRKRGGYPKNTSSFHSNRSEREKQSMRENIKHSLKVITQGVIPKNLDQNFEQQEEFGWTQQPVETETYRILGNSPLSIELRAEKKLKTGFTGNFDEVPETGNEEPVAKKEVQKQENPRTKTKRDIISLLKALHKEETISESSFPSLVME